MAKDQERRTSKDRRDSDDKRSEKFIKFFLPEEDEKRSGKDRRKPDSTGN